VSCWIAVDISALHKITAILYDLEQKCFNLFVTSIFHDIFFDTVNVTCPSETFIY
jgi:hypothetical protein